MLYIIWISEYLRLETPGVSILPMRVDDDHDVAALAWPAFAVGEGVAAAWEFWHFFGEGKLKRKREADELPAGTQGGNPGKRPRGSNEDFGSQLATLTNAVESIRRHQAGGGVGSFETVPRIPKVAWPSSESAEVGGSFLLFPCLYDAQNEAASMDRWWD